VFVSLIFCLLGRLLKKKETDENLCYNNKHCFVLHCISYAY